jgi:hypothetical protein
MTMLELNGHSSGWRMADGDTVCKTITLDNGVTQQICDKTVYEDPIDAVKKTVQSATDGVDKTFLRVSKDQTVQSTGLSQYLTTQNILIAIGIFVAYKILLK